MRSISLAEVAEALGVEGFEPAHDPVGEVYVRVEPDAGRAEVLYVARDPLPPRRFWPEDGSRGRLVSLRARDAAREAEGAALVLPVRVSPDGAQVVLPTGETRGSTHLYVPPPARSAAVAEGREDHGALLDWSARQLAAFDAWRRGETYGVVREILSCEDGFAEPQDVDAKWLRLDLDGAGEALEAEAAVLSEPRPGPRP